MVRPRVFWYIFILFCILCLATLAFFLWADMGYTHTIVIMSEELDTCSVSPDTTQVEQAPMVEEPPSWLLSVRWATLSAAAVLAIYILYAEIDYRRRKTGMSIH